MSPLSPAVLSIEHQKIAGVIVCVLVAAFGAYVLLGQRRDAIRRRCVGGDRPGDPHYDPYACSPVPYDDDDDDDDPATCVRCRTPLPDAARFCPECGASAVGEVPGGRGEGRGV